MCLLAAYGRRGVKNLFNNKFFMLLVSVYTSMNISMIPIMNPSTKAKINMNFKRERNFLLNFEPAISDLKKKKKRSVSFCLTRK